MSNKQKANAAREDAARRGLIELRDWIDNELSFPTISNVTMCELTAKAYQIKIKSINVWRANL